jgi:plastocyanin
MRRKVAYAAARVTAAALGAGVLLGASGCQLVSSGENLVAGKQAFVAHCGACHTLARAGTTGVTGPNLDEAFQQARKDGFGESTIQGVVRDQIAYPARGPQNDPQTGRQLAIMPANLVTGQAAKDVAAYVASAAGKPGSDTGRLAQIGQQRSKGVARERDGTLTIPVVQGGGLAFDFGSAQAKAGQVTMRSPNPQSMGHNIAIEGNGVDVKGPVVQNGGVSEVRVNLKPGRYTFYCSVPGHREGGMVGTLTVR